MPSGSLTLISPTTGSVSTNFSRSVATSSIVLPIPKYSRIVSAVVSGTFSTEAPWSASSLRYSFASHNMSNNSNDGPNLYDWGNVSGGFSSDKTTKTASFPYLHSENVNAGKYNGNWAYFGFIRKSSSKIWTLHDFTLNYSYENPACTIQLSNDNDFGDLYVNGNLTESQNYSYTITTSLNETITLVASPKPDCKFVRWDTNRPAAINNDITNPNITFTVNQNLINKFEDYINFTPVFERIAHTVTFKNYDGTIICSNPDQFQGQPFSSSESYYAACGCPTPTKPFDKNYHYVFSGWSISSDTKIYSSVDAIAQFTAVPHSMSYALTAEGRRHHTCSGCEYNYFERPYDLCQENLFHFSDWMESDCNTMNQGSNSYDILNGTITIAGNGDCYTMYGGGNNYYHIPITPGEEYIFKYNVLTTGTKQAFVFFYNSNGSAVNGVGISQPHIGKYDGTPIIFTAPEEATQLAIRVGVRDTSTATFSNLIVCKTKHLRSLNETTSLIRRAYFADQAVSAIGNSSSLTLVNAKRKGFDFNGWYNDENLTSLLSLPINLNSSKTIYPKWFERLGILGDKTIKIFNGTQQAKVLLGKQKLF